jgi:hypothetical protein
MTDETTSTPAELASIAGDAVRGLAHATQSSKGELRMPGDAYDTVANLKQVASSLPQCLDQISLFLSGLDAADHLYSDRGDLNRRVAESLAGLADAARAADALYRALDRAHSGLGALGYKD